MGRAVLADQTIETYIQHLIQKNQWYIGLIIGQLTAQKDFAIHLARTPEPEENRACEETEVNIDDHADKPKKPRPPKSLEDADEHWVATHAKQVTRMLPGGFDVIGIFAVASGQMLKNSQSKLRQMIFAVQKAVTKNIPIFPGASISERVILQVDTHNSKVFCSTVDVSNAKNKDTPRPAEWRYQTSPVHWLQLNSAVAVDVTLPVSLDSRQQSLLKHIQQSISPFCKGIWKSIVTFNGHVRAESETLVLSLEGKKGKSKEKGAHKRCFEVNFFMPLEELEDIPEPKIAEVKEMVSIRGITVCRAFVHSKATVGDAMEAIKTDVVRSLWSRCELLCEDVALVDDESTVRQLFDTPVRVFCNLFKQGAQVCDYMFQDEKLEEVLQRIKELMDVNIAAESLQMDCERPARDNDWVTASASEYSLSTQPGGSSVESTGSSHSLLVGIVSGTLTAVGAVLAYLYIGENR